MIFSILRSARRLQLLAFPALLAFATAGCTPEARKDRQLIRADGDFEAGKYDSAELEYRAALDLVSMDPVAVRQLGLIYLHEGRLVKALTYLRKGVELDPTNVAVRLGLGQALAASDMPKDAAEAAKWVLAHDPRNADALFLLVRCIRTPKDLDDTQRFLDQAHQRDQDCSGYHLAAGVLRLDQRDPAGAEKEFRKALELDPKASDALLELGNLLWARQEVKAAGEALKSASDLAPLRSPAHLRYLDFQLGTGAVEEAKKALSELNRKAPDYIPGLVYTMDLALKERRFDDCNATIGRILEREPSDYDALLTRGEAKLAQGDAAGAVAALKRAEEVYDKVPMIKFQLALGYLRLEDTTRAESCLSQAILIAPDFDLAVLLMAELDLRKGDAPDAIASLTPLIARRPELARGYLLLGQAFEAQHNYDQAQAIYRRMGALFPKDPQAPYLIGLILARQNLNAEARRSFEASVAIAADYVPALEMLVNADLRDYLYAQAMQRTDALAQKFPKSPVPWLLRAKVHSAQHDPDAAAGDLRKAIALDPKSENPYLLLARIYVTQKKYEPAVEQLTAAADQARSEAALLQLGLLDSELRRYEASRQAYQRLLAVDPKATSALNNLAYLECEHLADPDHALELAKRAHSLAPDDPATTDTLGWVLFRKGDYPGALALLQAAAKSDNDPAIQYHLGMVHAMLADEQLARAAFQRALASTTNFPEREDARRQLAFLDLDVSKADKSMLAELEQQVRASPNNPTVLVRLAAVQASEGASREAAVSYEHALRLNPRDAQTTLALAQLYAGPLKDPKRASELAKSAHELAPDDPQISRTLGSLLYEAGDFPWSLDLLVEAERVLPEQPDLTYDLARAYYSVGQVADAESTLQELLQNSTPFARRDEAKRLAAMIAAGDNAVPARGAFVEAEQTLQADPSSIPALMVAARTAEQQGDYQTAAQRYERILAADAYFSPAMRQLAVLYALHLGNDQKAYDLAVKVRPKFPDDPELPKVFGIVAYRQAAYGEAVRWLKESLLTRSDDPQTIFYLGLAHYQLKDLGSSKLELKHALELGLSGPEADHAKSILGQSNQSAPP